MLFCFLNWISGHIDLKMQSYQITEHGQDAEEEEQDIADEDQNIDENQDIDHCDIDHDEDQGAIPVELIYSFRLPNGESPLVNPMRHLNFLIEHFPKETRKGNKKCKKGDLVEHTEKQKRMNWCLQGNIFSIIFLTMELFAFIVRNL